MNNGIRKLVAFLLFFVSCQQVNEPIEFNEEYSGYWLETGWHYTFYTDRHYQFRYAGHCCDGKEFGRYAIVDNQILLMPDTDWVVEEDNLLKRKLTILDHQVLQDIDGVLYSSNLEAVNKFLVLDSALQAHVEQKIESVPMIRKQKVEFQKKLNQLDRKPYAFDEVYLEFYHKFWIGREEYDKYILKSRLDFKVDTLMYLQVKKKPLQIWGGTFNETRFGLGELLYEE